MLVTVSTHVDPIDAHIMRCRLEADGIPVFIAHEHHISMNWLVSTALGGVKVQVSSTDAEAAKRIIEAVQNGAYELPEVDVRTLACPNCGSAQVLEDKRMWRLSFLSFFLLSIPLPFSRHKLRCLSCGRTGGENEF